MCGLCRLIRLEQAAHAQRQHHNNNIIICMHTICSTAMPAAGTWLACPKPLVVQEQCRLVRLAQWPDNTGGGTNDIIACIHACCLSTRAHACGHDAARRCGYRRTVASMQNLQTRGKKEKRKQEEKIRRKPGSKTCRWLARKQCTPSSTRQYSSAAPTRPTAHL